MVTETMREKWDDRIWYLCDHDEELNVWEMDFIDDMDAKRAAGRDLTSRQVGKLYEIYRRVNEKSC